MKRLLFSILLLSYLASAQGAIYSCTQIDSENTIVFKTLWGHDYSVEEHNGDGEIVRVIANNSQCENVSVTNCHFSPLSLKDEDVRFSYVCDSGTSKVVQTLDIYRSKYTKKLVVRFRCNNLSSSEGIFFQLGYPANDLKKCSKID